MDKKVWGHAMARVGADAFVRPERAQASEPYNPAMAPPRTGKQKLQRLFLYLVGIVLASTAFIWITDYCIFRIRIATNSSPYGSVQVNHYYAIAQKNGKTQFVFDPPGPQACVKALFPHAGLKPCWYLSRHPDQRTDI